MANPFDSFNTTPPAGQETPAPEVGTENQTPTTEQTSAVETKATETKPPEQAQTTKPEEFIDTFNKRFNTQYKTEDEIKPLFELPKKVTEYEGRVKDRDELAKSVEQKNKDLETLKRTEATRYLSDPLMQRAYVANQLLKKYPDKDPFILQEIAMSDVSKMGDLEIVAKERKIKYPTMQLENIKKVIMSDLGIDATVAPEEWDSLAKDKLTMMAGDARENIRRLTEGIDLPKVATPEEVEVESLADIQKRTDKAKPAKENFLKTDKFNIREGLDYTIPEEFKTELSNIFDVYILKAGNEPNEENMKNLADIGESLFFSKYKDKIYETMYKDVETKLKKLQDIENGNATPPNTATASDSASVSGENASKPGVSQFIKDVQGQRVRSI